MLCQVQASWPDIWATGAQPSLKSAPAPLSVSITSCRQDKWPRMRAMASAPGQDIDPAKTSCSQEQEITIPWVKVMTPAGVPPLT